MPPNVLHTSVKLWSLITGEHLHLNEGSSICSSHPVSQALSLQAALIILQSQGYFGLHQQIRLLSRNAMTFLSDTFHSCTHFFKETQPDPKQAYLKVPWVRNAIDFFFLIASRKGKLSKLLFVPALNRQDEALFSSAWSYISSAKAKLNQSCHNWMTCIPSISTLSCKGSTYEADEPPRQMALKVLSALSFPSYLVW